MTPFKYLNCLWSCVVFHLLMSTNFLQTLAKSVTNSEGGLHSISSTPTLMTTEFCENWKTYRDPMTGRCLPCSRCPDDHITVVLCEFDRDTLCRPSTDLAEHILGVIHSTPSLNESVLLVEVMETDKTGDYSPALIVMALSALLVACIVLIAFYLVRRRYFPQLKTHDSTLPPYDSLNQGLLEDDDAEEDAEKPAELDMDELLAQRYGRSLVTNHYVL